MPNDALTTAELLGMGADYNPRTISDFMLERLCGSIRAHGLVQAIVVNRRTAEKGWPKEATPVIVGGHQRVRAAEMVELERCDVRWVDEDAKGERELNLQLNQVDGDFERDLLEAALREYERMGGNVVDTGFTPEQIAEIYGTPSLAPDEFPDATDDVKVECPKCGYRWNE